MLCYILLVTVLSDKEIKSSCFPSFSPITVEAMSLVAGKIKVSPILWGFSSRAILRLALNEASTALVFNAVKEVIATLFALSSDAFRFKNSRCLSLKCSCLVLKCRIKRDGFIEWLEMIHCGKGSVTFPVKVKPNFR